MIASYLDQARLVLDTAVAVFRRDPGVSPTATLLTLAAVVVIVIIVILILLLLLTPKKRMLVRRKRIVSVRTPIMPDGVSQDSGPEDVTEDVAEPTQPPGSSARRMVTGWALVLVVSVGVIAATYIVSGTNYYCTSSCHVSMMHDAGETGSGPMVATAATRTPEPERAHHAECTSCHSSGFAADVSDRVRMLVASLAGRTGADASAIVDSGRCLACHTRVLDGVITGSSGLIIVSHVEPHEVGMPCTACHQRIGHVDEVGPGMSQCIECHDARAASAECSTCHTVNPTDGAVTLKGRDGSGGRVYSLVPLSSGNCYGCHAPDACDACHGVRLPHPAAYVQGGHAYDAAWQGKYDLCYNCHEPFECNACHQTFGAGSGHPPEFQQSHKQLSPNTPCPCHDGRRPAGALPGPFCQACH